MKKSRRYDTSQPLLDVYLHDELVGNIGRHEPEIWFRYAALAHESTDPERYLISVHLPVRPEPFTHEETLGFFDNLLLEEEMRDALASATHHDRRDTAGLLGLVGGECAGAVSLWPHGTPPPDTPRYRPCSAAAITDLFTAAHGAPLTLAQLEARQSMSGAQDKLVFRRSATGYELPLEGAPGNVLVKRPSPRYDGLVHNELAGQRLMQALGVPAAESRAIVGPAMLFGSVRFDRPSDGRHGMQRLHQEDFCQALGRSPLRKYQANNGPGFADMARVLRAHSANPAEDLDRLMHAVIINICLGNGDAHAKNFALLYTLNGLRLAPMYDVLSTEVYQQLTSDYAMYFGGAHRASELDRAAIARFARDVGMTPAAAHVVIDDILARLPDAWSGVRELVMQEAGDHPKLDEMSAVLDGNLDRLKRAAAGR